MSVYPTLFAGQRLTAAVLQSMVEDYTIKAASTVRASTVTPTADPDLAGIVLPVGINHVSMMIFAQLASAVVTIDLRTQWLFTGAGAAAGVRSCHGPAVASTSAVDTGVQMRGAGFTTNVDYGMSATFFMFVEEECLVTVTTSPMTLALGWSQAATSATTLTVGAGSYVKWKQVG